MHVVILGGLLQYYLINREKYLNIKNILRSSAGVAM